MSSPREWAELYLEIGWVPIALPLGSKSPSSQGWQRATRESAEAAVARGELDGGNVGVLLGDPSGWLVDVDLDAPEAVRAADAVLPPTPAVFGRPGKPRSHRLYVSTGAKTRRRYVRGGPVLVELRSTRAQTVFPPSTHEGTGEAVEWDGWDGEPPAELPAAELTRAVALLAVAAALGRAWPAEGARHDAALALAGGLLSSGLTIEEAERVVRGACAAAGDPEVEDRARAVASTRGRLDAGDHVAGWPQLELPLEVLDACRRWLGPARPVAGPGVIVLGPDMPRVVDEAFEVVKADPGVYQRAGRLVRPRRLEEREEDGAVEVDAGNAGAQVIPTPALRMVLARGARWVGAKGQCMPPPWVADQIEALPDFAGVRRLLGVVDVPTMRPDGGVIAEPGWDRATGLLYEPRGVPIKVLADPTRADAELALARLVEVLDEFAFVDERHLAAALAALLTMVGRAAVAGPVPIVVLDANAPGVGKTYLVDVLATVAYGAPMPRAAWTSDDDETRKAMLAVALAGYRSLLFDNVATALEGATLSMVVTAGRITGRVLGTINFVDLRWDAVVVATGNNVRTNREVARRALYVRQVAAVEHAELRSFTRPRLLAEVAERRPELYRDALTVLRAAALAAAADEVEMAPWGSFDAWSRVVRAPLLWLGLPDPVETREALGRADEESDAWAQALELLAARGTFSAQQLAESDAVRDASLRGLLAALGARSPLTPQGVGNVLGRYRDRVVAGMVLRSVTIKSRSLWRVEMVV